MARPSGQYINAGGEGGWLGKVRSLRELVQLCPKREAPKSCSNNIPVEVRARMHDKNICHNFQFSVVNKHSRGTKKKTYIIL